MKPRISQHVISAGFRSAAVWCALVLSSIGAIPLSAQTYTLPSDLETNVGTFYRFTRSGEASIAVNVVGAALPGVYEVGVDVGMRRLLVLAGGDPSGAEELRVRKDSTVRLVRSGTNGGTVVFESDTDAFFTDQVAIPELQDGDTIILHIVERGRFGWRDILSIVGSVATVALLVERLLN